VRLSSGIVALALAITACGSRSRLLESTAGAGGAGATSGSGGSVSGGGTSFGGTGGTSSGGAPFGGTGGGPGGVGGTSNCDGLFLAGEIIEVEHPANVLDGGPRLTASSDDGSRLTTAFIRETLSSSGFRQLVHASFSPWQSWPQAVLGPAFTTFASSELSTEFAVTPTATDRFGLLVAHVTPGAPGSEIVSFAPTADPLSSNVGPNLTLSSSGEPVFAAHGPAGYHFVGDSNGKMLMGHVVKYSGASFSVTDVVLSCGLDASVADAVAYPGGWLVALANEPTAPPTGCSAAANGATRLDVVRVGFDGAVSYVTSIANDTPILRLAMAPHPSGAYVTWRVASGGIVAPLRWARIEAETGSVIGPGEISQPFDYPLEWFDAALLGDQLAVVWGNDPANNPPDLTVTVVNAAGGLVTQTVIEPGFFGRLAIAASPFGDSVVVAWHQAAPTGSAGVKLARFDCYGAL